MRVQDLERLLKEHGIETGASSSVDEGQVDATQPKPNRRLSDQPVEVIEQTQREVPDDPRDLSRDHLVSTTAES
jgi:hypothetical protein